MAIEECDVCIIYCGNGVAYYQEEPDMGAPPRHILLEKGKKFIPNSLDLLLQ